MNLSSSYSLGASLQNAQQAIRSMLHSSAHSANQNTGIFVALYHAIATENVYNPAVSSQSSYHMDNAYMRGCSLPMSGMPVINTISWNSITALPAAEEAKQATNKTLLLCYHRPPREPAL